jgi:hypothetical protein
LVLDDKANKTPKSGTTLVFKGANTTKSSSEKDGKVFVFNHNKLISQNEADPKKQKSNRGNTPLNRTSSNNESEPITPTTSSSEKKPFIYYMTNMEKYHRSLDHDYFAQIYREHFMQTYQAMMFCRFLRPVDQKVLTQKKVYLNKRETHKGT